MHDLGNGVGSKFCLFTILEFNNINSGSKFFLLNILKFKNMPSGVKNGVLVGATDDIVITVTRKLHQPTL